MNKNKNNINKELISRRNFFRKSVHKILPILTLLTLQSPLFSMAQNVYSETSCKYSCKTECSNECNTQCTKTCAATCKIYVAVIVKELVGIQGNAITAPIVAKTIVLAAAKIHVNLYRKEKLL